MDRREKRQYERLGAKFELSYRKIGSQISQTGEGSTVNVSPGGVYFRTKAGTFKRGDLLKIELNIPPRSGQLEFGGRMAGFAEVLRVDTICNASSEKVSSGNNCGVALQFCRPPKLCV